MGIMTGRICDALGEKQILKRVVFIVLFVLLTCVAWSKAASTGSISESAREISVAYDVDVVVVGGGIPTFSSIFTDLR